MRPKPPNPYGRIDPRAEERRPRPGARDGSLEVGFPFRVDAFGRVADPGYPEHVRQLIEQLLFTDAGERVNRPDLGAGLLRRLFGSENAELIAVTEHQVSTSLARWLGQVIEVRAVRVTTEDSELTVTVQYVLRKDRSSQTEVFRRSVETFL